MACEPTLICVCPLTETLEIWFGELEELQPNTAITAAVLLMKITHHRLSELGLTGGIIKAKILDDFYIALQRITALAEANEILDRVSAKAGTETDINGL